MRKFGAAILATVLVLPVMADSLPVAPVRNVDEVFYGTTVTDPYRYFEDIKTPEVAGWIKAHSDYAYDVLKHIRGRGAMLTELEKYEAAITGRVGAVVRTNNGAWFYEKRGAKDNQFKLFMRSGPGAKEVLLVDPDMIEQRTGKPHAINYFYPSPNGRYVAYGLSMQGSEAASLYVMDVQTGRNIGQPVSRGDFALPDWAPDGSAIDFTRLQEMKPGMAPTQRYQNAEIFRFSLSGAKLRTSAMVNRNSPGIQMRPAEIPFLSKSYDGKWAFALVINGTQREFKIYAAPQADVTAHKAHWRRLVDYADAVTDFTYKDGALYLVTHQSAPRSEIRKLNVTASSFAAATVVVPKSDRVLIGVAAASDALYIESREGNVKRLSKLEYGADARLQEIRLPLDGAFSLTEFEANIKASDPRLPGAVIKLQNWVHAPQLYSVNPDGSVNNTGLQPAGPYDAPENIETREVLVSSYDGAKVPMSIMYRKGTQLNGDNPTLLYGYGSYGITEEPLFSTARLAWLNSGGVYAVANPRGTSVFGEEWYRAGFQSTKPNTWKDFIACAEFLIAQGYTKPARLGISGGSAGGILVGRAMTERPDLFAAVVVGAGAVDTLRAEFTANGVPNIPEFGSVKTEEGFKGLLAMSTLAHVQDGTRYPAVLLTGGINDPRVEIWESAKLGARMLAASTSGKPVLLRVDYDAGHGIGNTKKQQLEQRADIYSFLLWQMGQESYELTR
jgi:prolyl oligopeptidase